MHDITIILTTHRRSQLLLPQLAAVRAQSVPARQVWLWANEPDAAIQEKISSASLDRVVVCQQNAFVHARFALALTAPTELVAIFDDDTIPGSRWLENCLSTFSASPGILGTAGVRLVGPQYQ